jgi:TIR domain
VNGVRDRVFVSYSHDDEQWWRRLRTVLAAWTRGEPTAIWWDGFIEAGQKWREEIDKALAAARVAVLLVSPNFLASEFIIKEELPKILDAAESEGVRVLWCMVRKCWYEETRIKDYQGAHDPKKAWNALSETELDELLVEVAKKIKQAQQSAPEPPARTESREVRASEAPAAEPAAGRGVSVPAPPPPEPQRAAKTPPAAAEAETGHRSAERLLSDVHELKVVDEIGNLFVLRHRWSDAEFTYDRMIELAAPYQESWMAQGYEKLGVVRQRQNRLRPAAECWKLAQVLYRRVGETERADEVRRRLQAIPAPPAAASNG